MISYDVEAEFCLVPGPPAHMYSDFSLCGVSFTVLMCIALQHSRVGSAA